jgi:hypothetical protein
MANMMMTVVEGRVPAERWADLEQSFSRIATKMPATLVHTFLTQESGDSTFWRLIGMWQSRADFDEYRASVETPSGLLVFREAGVEPTLKLFEVKGQQST